MTPQDLLQYIGQSYQRLDDNGKALGCMAPIYMLYPDIPRYDWPDEGDSFIADIQVLLKKHGQQVDGGAIQPGDVLAFRMPFGFLHLGVYLGEDWMIHCTPGDTMERCRLGLLSRRLEGIYRWDSSRGRLD